MPLYAPPVQVPGYVNPLNAGFKAWSIDPAAAVNQTTVSTAGLLYLTALWNNSTLPISVSSVNVVVGTAGATLTNVGFALYDYSATGALLTSSVNANGATAVAFQSLGQKTVTFTAQTIAANTGFYVGFWFTGTTRPGIVRGASTAGVANTGFTATPFRFGTSTAALTTAAPDPMGAQTVGGNAWLVTAS